jgi:hypothetical protein
MRRSIKTRITPLRSKHTSIMGSTYASPRLTQTLGVVAQINALIHRYIVKRVVPTRCDMTLFMHRNMLAAAWNNSWKLLTHYTTLGHTLTRLPTWCEPCCTRQGNGPQWVVRRKNPGHQGVSLSNLLSLDGGRQPGHPTQVKLETRLVHLEGLGANLVLRLGGSSPLSSKSSSTRSESASSQVLLSLSALSLG